MEGRHRVFKTRKPPPEQPPSLRQMIRSIAHLGGFPRPQNRWRAGNPNLVARPPANGRHHRRLSQLPHRLRHAAINRPTARTPPRDPNDRQQTAYSSLSDADLWGKIRTWSGHPWLRAPETKTWMRGSSPRKTTSERFLRVPNQLSLQRKFPRTALRESGDPGSSGTAPWAPGPPLSRG